MDRLTRERRSWNMSRIKSADTQPEMIVRQYLRKSGFRYRIKYKVAGNPDLVFPKHKIAIFVHGCFWHKHDCKNSVIPKTHKAFWVDKLNRNVARDKLVLRTLRNASWKVRTIWECQIEFDRDKTNSRLINFLSKNGIKSKSNFVTTE